MAKNENQFLKDINSIKQPHSDMKNLGMYLAIYDLPEKTIDEIREEFLLPNVELKHKLKKYFIDFRLSWELFLFGVLSYYWENYTKKNSVDEKQKLEFLQSVYLSQKEYLSNLIALIIMQYDNEKNSKEKIKLGNSIKELEFSYLDIHKLIAIHLRSHIVLLDNRKTFEIKYDKFVNPKYRKYKRATAECKKIFAELYFVKTKLQYESDSWIYDRILAGYIFKDRPNELLSYSHLKAWHNKNKKEVYEINSAITDAQLKEYKKLFQRAHAGTLIR